MHNMHVVKETTLTVEKKHLVQVLPYLGSISLQTRTELKKSLKNILCCCKLQIVFKSKTRLGNNFHFKDRIPKNLTSGVVFVSYIIQCKICNESFGNYSNLYSCSTSPYLNVFSFLISFLSYFQILILNFSQLHLHF